MCKNTSEGEVKKEKKKRRILKIIDAIFPMKK